MKHGKKSEMLVPTPEVMRLTNLLNDYARGNALLEYKRMIENLSEDLRIDKVSSEAGFIQTVAYMTIYL